MSYNSTEHAKSRRATFSAKLGHLCTFAFTLFLLTTLFGCTTMPFDPPAKTDYRNVDPAQVTANFDAAVAKDFELLESVVFEFFGKALTGMGYLAVESDTEKYALSCMTPASIKLFEFRGEGSEVEALFVPPPLEDKREMFTQSVAQDIRRIYFDWTPPTSARLKHKKDRLVYRAENTEYIFAGPDYTLAQKHFLGGWRKQCSIYYFNYEKENGKLYPKAIVLHNRKYHYRLILRVKSVQTPPLNTSSLQEKKATDEHREH